MTDEERFFYNHGYKQAERDFIKELEKIKEKMQEFAHYDSDYCGFVLPEWKVSDIIYEYIQELKGE